MKKVKLAPDEMSTIMKLNDDMIRLRPHCCADAPISWATSYLTLHDINDTFATFGSCLISTMNPADKLKEILKEKSNYDVWQDNIYKK